MRIVGTAVMAAFAAGWAVAACGASPAFVCQADSQCVRGNSEAGRCQPDGYCGFSDTECMSGLRYGEHSGVRSGDCVPAVEDGPSTGPSSTGQTGEGTDAPRGTTTTSSTPEGTSTVSVATGGPDTEDTATTAGTGSEPADPSLVLWLTLDDVIGDGLVMDSSDYGNDGSCAAMACPDASAGVVGDAARLDGVDDLILVSHHPSLETPEGFTIAAWIYLDAPPTVQRSVFTKTVGDSVFNSWELYFGGGTFEKQLLFSMATKAGETTARAPRSISTDQWVHIAGTWDGQAMTLWVDGTPVDSQPLAALMMDDHSVVVGGDDDNNGAYSAFFAGAVDDVRIYDRPLPAPELAALAGPSAP